MKINEGITLALLLWNLLIFLIYGIDKSKARRGAWRIPEKILLILALTCGGFGAWLAGITFHQKTRKWYFKTSLVSRDGNHTSSLIFYLEVMDGRKIDF